MSDAGEKTCPLCAEEMDLTDQQLKPCKCGYEICIWCWHHIIDMAEKDETEGRCPACRAPYNKEKVVGTAANCERLVAEINMERKIKSQKAKNKTSEGRKQLSSVRVIQRNLVYIVGLPLILADEDLLQHKEYFGQYGKVLKVSISRTASGAIQQFSNSTCSVYITYSKEEEAVRCIQYVHGFVLEGRTLRACFGTTKYCHAWLRNMPCSNPDCLYLHEIGSQEDSFTKDEIVSAYTRVQQITGAANNMQRRSGNVLPPPADDCLNNSSAAGKPLSKSAVNNTAGNVRGSPPNSSSGVSDALPAASSWGTRASNSQPLSESFACSDEPSKRKAENCGGSMADSSAIASSTQASLLRGDVGKKLIPNEESRTIEHKGSLEPLDSAKLHVAVDCQATTSEKELNVNVNGKIEGLCSDMSSMSIDRNFGNELSNGTISSPSLSGPSLIKSPRDHGLQSEQFREASSPLIPVKAMASTDNFQSDSPMQARVRHQMDDEDVLSFDYQRHKDPEVVSRTSFLPSSSLSFDHTDRTRVFSAQHTEAYGSNTFGVGPQVVDTNVDKVLLQHASGLSVLPNGYTQNPVSSSADSNRVFEGSYLFPEEGKRTHMGRCERETANVNHNAAVDMGESSIISNILSMDFDTWDESLTSPQNLARFMGKPDSQDGSLKSSNSWKVQNSNQSRFSFARQEESQSREFGYEPRFSNIGQVPRNRPFSHDIERRDSYFDKPGSYNGISPISIEEFDIACSSNSQVASNQFPVSRAQIPAPPGFSVPNRAPPPPGFTSQERVEPAFGNLSGNHLLGNSLFLRNSYQAPPNGNISSTGDLEFMDPAILAVGKGRLPVGHNNTGLLDTRPYFPPQSSAFEDEARLQLLMQRSFSTNHDHRFAETRDSFVPLNGAYNFPTRNVGIMEQSTASNISPFSQLSSQQSRGAFMSNGHWDGWNEVQSGNDMAMAELLRTERLGLNNKFYTGYEDSKFRMPSSGNLYNRTFGI